MKFNEMKYERLDIEAIQAQLEKANNQMKEAKNFQEAKQIFEHVNEIHHNVDSISNLAYIRYTLNVNDEFYKEEMAFIDENSPKLTNALSEFMKTLLASPFKEDFKDTYGKHFITINEYSSKLNDHSVIDLLVEENKLKTQYNQITGNGKVVFRGEELPTTRMRPYMTNVDRQTRKDAWEAYSGFFKSVRTEIETTYQSLVDVRVRLAKQLGYESYIDYAYVNRKRYDYNQSDVESLRKNVKTKLVPALSKLLSNQKDILGIDHVHYYDYEMIFRDGGVQPIISEDEMIDAAQKMYGELSPKTKEFFDFMKDNDLLDLKAREGKMPGGYCTFISNYRSPFIFSNFNGTSDDVDVLTHEAGHAYDVFQNRDQQILDYIWGGFDIAEIHSMSMEFFTYPWMELFFGDKVNKYKYQHLLDNLKFIPYGLLVDEFQHKVFENPSMSMEEINATWRKLEKEYLPLKDYSENAFLDEGTFWYKQSHIFTAPFYYVDYVLAQITAFQFFLLMQKDYQSAFNTYDSLVSRGGTQPFLETLLTSGLNSPFKVETIEEIISSVSKYLETLDVK